MNTSKQEQQQKFIGAIDTDKPYEWSYIRVAEGIVTYVVSAAIIGSGAIFVGVIYAGWLLLLSALHTPAGIVGILAFILLGAVLVLLSLGIAIVAWFRHMSSATLAGMVLGAVVGAAIGAAIDSGKWKNFDVAEMVKRAQKQEESNPR